MATCAPPKATPFFAGKTLRILVGFSPGGGYDLYARELGRYMDHLAGNPAVVVQNMPGAGSLKAVNYLYNAAPRDGTVIATFARGIVFEPLIGHPDGAQFEAAKFNWVGSVSNEVGVCGIMGSRGIASWQDMLTKRTLIGASGAGADSDAFSIVLRNLFKLPMKIVTGYPGGADMNLAMERGEIDGRCGWSWSSILSTKRDWLVNKQIRITLQIALAKHEDLPDVPLIMDLVNDPAAARRSRSSSRGKASPGPSRRRPRCRRNAWIPCDGRSMRPMADPEFLAEMRRLSGSAPGRRRRGAELDARNLCLAARGGETRARTARRDAVVLGLSVGSPWTQAKFPWCLVPSKTWKEIAGQECGTRRHVEMLPARLLPTRSVMSGAIRNCCRAFSR